MPRIPNFRIYERNLERDLFCNLVPNFLLHRIIVGIKNYKYIVTIPPESWQKVYEKASSERLNPLGLQDF